MTDLVIDIPGLPVPYARSGGRGNIRFTPKKQREAMADLKIMASQKMNGKKPFDGPLYVEMMFSWPFPKSMSGKRRADPANHWKTARPDASNCAKLVEDALNGVCWRDDALIVRLHVWKVLGDTARTIITIKPAGAFG